MPTETNHSVSPTLTTAVRRVVRSATRTVLIAEDDADNREMMQVLLALKGFRVITANDGFEALLLSLGRRPDLIVLDLELPHLNGIEVTKSLRLHPALKDVPILVVSGHNPAKYRQPALDAGCNDYLLKPIDFEGLDRMLDKLFSSEPDPARINASPAPRARRAAA